MGGGCGLDQSGSGWGQALVNTVMNLWFHKMRGISRLAEDLLASHEVYFVSNWWLFS